MNVSLELRSVTKRFGGLAAVQDVSFAVRQGETLGIIGPNGAGKTTLLNLITGVFPVTSGHILLDDDEITGLSPDRICKRGIGRTYQIPQPFQSLTVKANVMLGCLYGRAMTVPMPQAAREAAEILQRVGLANRSESLAGDLTLLERKRLELARALSLQPRLILLDEIGAGLTKPELPPLKALIRDLQSTGISIVLIEHVLELVFDLCQRVLVLNWGEKLVEGSPAEVAGDERVIEAYLGAQGSAQQRGRACELPTAGVRAAEPEATPRPTTPLLQVRNLGVAYGAFQALSDVSLEVWPGEIVALLGANGSGKSTLVRAISSMVKPFHGEILLDGSRTDVLPPDSVVELGVAQCMEGRRIFPELSVLDNLEVGAYARRARIRAKEMLGQVYDLFPLLYERRNQQGQTLSGGEQQMLAIGRALMANPRLLLLDEVSLGLAPVVIDKLYEAIGTINKRGVAILLVEQNVHRSLTVAHRGYILERGCMSLSGSAAELAASDRLAEHYFGL
jgi:branched-chain amino acid transport system ATP-binding protein